MQPSVKVHSDPRPVLILGMHRSGTSCLAGSLEQAGLYLGNVFTRNEFNLKGNRENKQVMALNDAVLNDNGGSWYSPPDKVNWSPERLQELRNIVRSFGDRGVFGVKDPRLLLTIEGWLEVLGDVQLVASFRNPASVAQSLIYRNPELGDEAFWTHLWFEYNSRLLDLYRKRPFPLINFDLPEPEYNKSLQKLIGQLGFGEEQSQNHGLASTLSNLTGSETFFDARLRHHELNAGITYSASMTQILKDLRDTAGDFMNVNCNQVTIS